MAMRLQICVSLFVTQLVSGGSAFLLKKNGPPIMMDSEIRADTSREQSEPLASPLYFEQKQDHYDGANTNTWQQTYYMNDTFWKGDPNAPVFLCCGGEGPPLDGSVVRASPHCNDAVEWLEETGALMFALEHRYYTCHNPNACPVDLNGPGNTHDKLRYLSSRQALADLAHFVQFATEKYKLARTNKWVSFGGSYPGMLAGWLRLKYPHLVHAAVASSAPVHAKLDMSGFNDVVTEAYGESDVGGSADCVSAIRDGHAKIGTLLSSEGNRKQLVTLFPVGLTSSDLADINHQRAFCGDGVAEFPAQSNDPVCTAPACNIEKICKIMTNTEIGEPIERLAKVAELQGRFEPQRSGVVKTNLRLKTAMEDSKNVNELMDQLWAWQTCTEFGFYQTCEVGSNCFYTQGLSTLESKMEFCKTLYGLSKEQVERNIEESNWFYGSDHPAGSRVLYLSGSVDPWKALSKVTTNDPEAFPVKTIPGSSHHRWTYPSSEISQASVRDARKIVYHFVAKWLKED